MSAYAPTLPGSIAERRAEQLEAELGQAAAESTEENSSGGTWASGQVTLSSPSRSRRARRLTMIIPITLPSVSKSKSTACPSGVASVAAAKAGVRINADELGVLDVLAGPGFDLSVAERRTRWVSVGADGE
jgi:hypothetical protein